ncbi:peroxidase [Gracilaria domingensis]|nr:peroxidase [Gracilaria domingensis]
MTHELRHDVTRSGHIRTNDNIRLYYEECGSGHPLILIHALAASCKYFEPNFRELGSRFRRLPCAPAGGRSARRDGAFAPGKSGAAGLRAGLRRNLGVCGAVRTGADLGGHVCGPITVPAARGGRLVDVRLQIGVLGGVAHVPAGAVEGQPARVSRAVRAHGLHARAVADGAEHVRGREPQERRVVCEQADVQPDVCGLARGAGGGVVPGAGDCRQEEQD